MSTTSHTPALIDSHCHLQSIDLTDFDGQIEVVLERAKAHDVVRMLCVCIEPGDLSVLSALADRYPNVWISAGIHPNVTLEKELDAAALVDMANHEDCIAIGETGLDYYRTEKESDKNVQRSRFRAHIQAALITGKPLIIHTRDASEDTLSILSEEGAEAVGGVIHCFTETWAFALKALELGFYISLSGIVTFKNALDLQAVAKKVPSDRLLIETDAPYLAPVPYRGKQNHPALVKHVAEALSSLRNSDYETIAQTTTDNFYQCFRL